MPERDELLLERLRALVDLLFGEPALAAALFAEPFLAVLFAAELLAVPRFVRALLEADLLLAIRHPSSLGGHPFPVLPLPPLTAR